MVARSIQPNPTNESPHHLPHGLTSPQAKSSPLPLPAGRLPLSSAAASTPPTTTPPLPPPNPHAASPSRAQSVHGAPPRHSVQFLIRDPAVVGWSPEDLPPPAAWASRA